MPSKSAGWRRARNRADAERDNEHDRRAASLRPQWTSYTHSAKFQHRDCHRVKWQQKVSLTALMAQAAATGSKTRVLRDKAAYRDVRSAFQGADAIDATDGKCAYTGQ